MTNNWKFFELFSAKFQSGKYVAENAILFTRLEFFPYICVAVGDKYW